MIRKDIDAKNLRKIILKYSKDIPVVGEQHRGVFSITGFRVYNQTPNTYYTEIDVEFNGEIKVSVYSLQGDNWIGAEIKKNEKYQVSPIRVNKFLRNRLFKQLNSHIAYFNTNIRNTNSIKTIKWI